MQLSSRTATQLIIEGFESPSALQASDIIHKGKICLLFIDNLDAFVVCS